MLVLFQWLVLVGMGKETWQDIELSTTGEHGKKEMGHVSLKREWLGPRGFAYLEVVSFARQEIVYEIRKGERPRMSNRMQPRMRKRGFFISSHAATHEKAFPPNQLAAKGLWAEKWQNAKSSSSHASLHALNTSVTVSNRKGCKKELKNIATNTWQKKEKRRESSFGRFSIFEQPQNPGTNPFYY